MNKLEQQEIESIRLELHDMFKNSPERPAIVFRITSRLWKLSHSRNSAHPNHTPELTGNAGSLTERSE